MMLTFGERFAETAAKKVGCPYIWAAKGLWRLDLTQPGKLIALPELSYDCSGLVTCCLFEAGGPDHRNDWSAQIMFDVLKPPIDGAKRPCLGLFGGGDDTVHHVAILLEGDVHGWVIEACGGDQTTLAPTPGKRVFLHQGAVWGTSYLRGLRGLPLVA